MLAPLLIVLVVAIAGCDQMSGNVPPANWSAVGFGVDGAAIKMPGPVKRTTVPGIDGRGYDAVIFESKNQFYTVSIDPYVEGGDATSPKMHLFFDESSAQAAADLFHEKLMASFRQKGVRLIERRPVETYSGYYCFDTVRDQPVGGSTIHVVSRTVLYPTSAIVVQFGATNLERNDENAFFDSLSLPPVSSFVSEKRLAALLEEERRIATDRSEGALTVRLPATPLASEAPVANWETVETPYEGVSIRMPEKPGTQIANDGTFEALIEGVAEAYLLEAGPYDDFLPGEIAVFDREAALIAYEDAVPPLKEYLKADGIDVVGVSGLLSFGDYFGYDVMMASIEGLQRTRLTTRTILYPEAVISITYSSALSEDEGPEKFFNTLRFQPIKYFEENWDFAEKGDSAPE